MVAITCALPHAHQLASLDSCIFAKHPEGCWDQRLFSYASSVSFTITWEETGQSLAVPFVNWISGSIAIYPQMSSESKSWGQNPKLDSDTSHVSRTSFHGASLGIEGPSLIICNPSVLQAASQRNVHKGHPGSFILPDPQSLKFLTF